MVRVFVYGTLRKGMYNHDIYLRERSVYCGDGYIKGSLMTIAGRLSCFFTTGGSSCFW